jgi:hypothetical protein
MDDCCFVLGVRENPLLAVLVSFSVLPPLEHPPITLPRQGKTETKYQRLKPNTELFFMTAAVAPSTFCPPNPVSFGTPTLLNLLIVDKDHVVTIRDLLKPGQMLIVGVTDPIDLKIESPEAVRDRVLEAAEFGQWGKTRSSKVWLLGIPNFATCQRASRRVAGFCYRVGLTRHKPPGSATHPSAALHPARHLLATRRGDVINLRFPCRILTQSSRYIF